MSMLRDSIPRPILNPKGASLREVLLYEFGDIAVPYKEEI
jgi:hypothetical protein